MALKFDNQGFLVGTTVELGKVLPVFQKILSEIRGLRRDLHEGEDREPLLEAVNRALRPIAGVSAQRTSGVAQPASSRGESARIAPVTRSRANRVLPDRDARGRFISERASAALRAAIAPVARTAPRSMPVSVLSRESNGRFAGAGGDRSGSAAASTKPSGKPGEKPRNASNQGEGNPGRETGGAGALSRASNALRAAPEIDPTIAAFHEAQAITAPIGRGLGSLLGTTPAKDRWYSRIWKELRGHRKEDGTYHRTEQRTLKEINDKTGRNYGGSLGNLLKKIPFVGGAAAGAAGFLGKTGAGLLASGAGLLGKGLRYGSKLGRRLPLIGGILAGGAALASIMGFGDDPNATPDENRAERFRGGGSGIGAVVGGLVGSLAGPLGAIAGAAIGDIVGEKVGKWLSTFDWELVGKDITETWESGVAQFTGVWKDVSAWLSNTFGVVSTAANAANSWVKDKTGLDVKAALGTAVDKAKSLGESALNYASARVEKYKRPLEGAVKAITGSGTGSGTAVSSVLETGPGYNVMQNADGTVTKQSGARNWRNNNPGNIEYGDFAKKFGAIGSDGRFAIFPSYEAGRKAKEALIFEGNGGRALSTKGDYGKGLGYKDKTLSQAIAAYAPQEENNTAAYQRAVLAAVNGQNKRMADYSQAERAAIMNEFERQEGFKVGKVELASARAVGPAQAVSLPAPVPVRTVSTGAAVPAVDVAAPLVQMASNTPQKVDVRISRESADVTQGLSDTKIARLASGGLTR